MATITTRAGKGSPLTNTEMDANLTNLNTYKLEDITGESVGDLSDVDITSTAPSDGQALIWDAANSKFIPGDSFSQTDFDTAIAAVDIDDLSNVNITSPSNGQSLTYNSSTSTWVNSSVGAQVESVTINTCDVASTVDSFVADDYRSVIYNVVLTTTAGYQSSEVRIMHNGTSAFLLESNKVVSNGTIGTFSSTISSGYVYLKVTTPNGPCVADFTKTEIPYTTAAQNIVPIPEDLMTGSATIDLMNGCGTIDLAA